MAKTIDKHAINEEIKLFKFDNSESWFTRFKLKTRWLSKSTKTSDKSEAIIRAIQLQMEYSIKEQNDIPLTKKTSKTSLFKTIAQQAIDRMQEDIDNETALVSYKHYIGCIESYFIPFFGDYRIKEVTPKVLMEFNKWRTEKIGREPARSTVMTHNTALSRVFDEAVIQQQITHTEIPQLKTTGRSGDRRAAFTRAEWNSIELEAKTRAGQGHKQVSRDLKTLMYHYIRFAILTGMRPGKEIEFLTWGDIHDRNINGKPYTLITVRKSKTTKFTGTREIVAKVGVKEVLKDMKSFVNKSNPSDLIFTVPSGAEDTRVGYNFRVLLNDLGLQQNSTGVRTLYSLRHTYISWEILNGTDINVIAKQCGTSVNMIHQHYDHIIPQQHAAQLSGAGAVLDLNHIDI